MMASDHDPEALLNVSDRNKMVVSKALLIVFTIVYCLGVASGIVIDRYFLK